jgi:hypothetical protein
MVLVASGRPLVVSACGIVRRQSNVIVTPLRNANSRYEHFDNVGGGCGLTDLILCSAPAGCLTVSYLVDPASSHMLVPKIKPCMSKYKPLYGETANGSLYQL